MSSICITSYILIGALDSNLQSCATIWKHLPQVGSKTIIWPPDRFNKGRRQSFFLTNDMRHWKLLGNKIKIFIFMITKMHEHSETLKLSIDIYECVKSFLKQTFWHCLPHYVFMCNMIRIQHTWLPKDRSVWAPIPTFFLRIPIPPIMRKGYYIGADSYESSPPQLVHSLFFEFKG